MANRLFRAIPSVVTCFLFVSTVHAGDAEKTTVLDAAVDALKLAPRGEPQDASWWGTCTEGSSVTVKTSHKDPKQSYESEETWRLVKRDKDGSAEVDTEVNGKKTGTIPPRAKSADPGLDRAQVDVADIEIQGASKLTIDGKELTCREFERTTTVHDGPGIKGSVYRVHAWSCDSPGVPGGVVKAVAGEVKDQGNGKLNFETEREMVVTILPRNVKVSGTEVLAWDLSVTYFAVNLGGRVLISTSITRSDQVPSGMIKLVVKNHGCNTNSPEIENTTEITSFSPVAGKSEKK